MRALDSFEKDLLNIVAKEGLVDESKLTPGASMNSLGIKSADMMLILMAIEEKFGVYIPVDGDLLDAKTIDDFVEAIRKYVNARQSEDT